jgi:ATP-dependent RNA helicase DDX31/DBP7
MLFLTSEEMDYLTILKERAILPEPLSFAHILQSLHSDAAKNRIYDDARGGTPAGAILQKQFEALVAAQPALKESAINAYHSYLRAYAAYPKALKAIFHPRKLHIGHVARSFALQDAPTLLAKSEIVSKQRAQDARDKEREAERRDMVPGGGDDVRSAAASKNATMNARKKLVPTSAAPVGPLGAKQVSRLHNAAHSSGAAAHAARAPASDSAAAIVASISAGVQPAFGQRDRARNVAAQASDAGFQERLLKRARKEKKETSNIGWRIGTETSGGGKAGKLARTGIDRARSNKVAAVFKKKKIDMVSEFAS